MLCFYLITFIAAAMLTVHIFRVLNESNVNLAEEHEHVTVNTEVFQSNQGSKQI